MESQPNSIDPTTGFNPQAAWLYQKVLRRELNQGRARLGMDRRSQGANQMSESFLEDLTKKAQAREGFEERCDRVRQQNEEALKRKAEEYRNRLRGYLRPELRGD